MRVFTVSDISDLCLHKYFCVRASSEESHTIFVSPVLLNLIYYDYYVFIAMLFITSSNHRSMSAFEFSKLQISFCVVKHCFKIMEEIMN